jgi:hypothetical protein
MRHSSLINNHQRDLEIRDDSHLFNDESCDRINYKCHNLFPFVSRYFTCPRFDQ